MESFTTDSLFEGANVKNIQSLIFDGYFRDGVMRSLLNYYVKLSSNSVGD